MAKDLEYYLAQARRIAEHREAGAEKEIRKLYKSMLRDLQTFISETYVQYAEDDKLTYAMLQKAGYDARFLEEIEQRLNISTPKAAQALEKLVEDTYEAAWQGMMEGVAKSATTGLSAEFAGTLAITPEQIKRAVQNPVYGLTLKDTLEKNRAAIIYGIKQTVGVGLMNGDRYTTMVRRIAEQVDGDYTKAIRIARTEAHRTREAGNADAAERVDAELQGTQTGLRMTKTWRTMKDERVRPQRVRRKKGGWTKSMGKGPNHMILDGQTVLADEPFDLQDGNTAMSPGQSGVAGHDINCRCYVSYAMMTDAEYFAKTGRHFPGWKDAEKSAETVENSGDNGIIELPDIEVFKGVGATGRNYPIKLPNGNHAKLAPGTKISKVKVFAGNGTNTPIRIANDLENEYKISAAEWKKVRGDGYIIENGKKQHVELHWYEAGDERVEMKVKRYFDES